ncbi:MAG: porin family protein [Chloracidobacterium sp.]|nr:porin family protein [Chloracidobacterium sp.]MDW8217831.1 outer membrane beta-barrel protein [Acidobacteriota bacterium]
MLKRMLKRMWLTAIAAVGLVWFSAPAYAQDVPQGELFAGFTYARLNDLTPRSPSQDAFGFNLQGVYNVNRVLGIVGDFGAHYDNATNLYTFMAGPRVNLRSDRLTPFAHVLLGGARASRVPVSGSRPLRFDGDGGFAMAVGGGLDVKVSDIVSLRPIQGEYMFTKIGGSGSVLRDTQSHLRLSFGVNFTFGKK